jgi:hypothetical protein
MKPDPDVGEVLSSENVTEEGGAHAVDIKVDLGGGDVVDAELFQPAGFDAKPLPGDAAAHREGDGGRPQALGFSDPKNASKAAPGEVRVYARSPDGTPVSEIWMKGDGSVEITLFQNKPTTLKSPGPVVVDSPDVTLGGTGGRKVACIGDICSGSLAAICAAPASPLAPAPPGTPGIVPFVCQIVSSCNNTKAG